MPIYEYKCSKCGHSFDHLARTLSDVARKCPECGARNPVKQLSTFSTSEGSSHSARTRGTCTTGTCPLN
ncbi:MAG: zinc ribbon domain-containing protein [Kiritimatiellae bacterium]|nr:zinc ribbon domain-containing protein [Kiritimatiellia bacterium]